jgi:hypothetical protein
LPAFTAAAADLLAGAFLAAFFATLFETLATGLAGAFFSALRAEETALDRADDFDFAADFSAAFLDFATALAMDSNYPKKGRNIRALHHFEGFGASRESLLSRARTSTS